MKRFYGLLFLSFFFGCCRFCHQENASCEHKSVAEQSLTVDSTNRIGELDSKVVTTYIGPYTFVDKKFSEIAAQLMQDSRQNLASVGCGFSLGFSGGVGVEQNGRVLSFQVPRLTIIEAFSFVADQFEADACYKLGCLWVKPKELVK